MGIKGGVFALFAWLIYMHLLCIYTGYSSCLPGLS